MITRYSDLIVHTTSPLPSPFHYTLRQLTAATSTSELTSIKKTAKKYGVIGIDEGQFVSANACSVGSVTSHLMFLSSQFPDIVEFCEDMANEGKTIIVAALDGTFQRKVHT